MTSRSTERIGRLVPEGRCRRAARALLLIALVLSAAGPGVAEERPEVAIGMVLDGPWAGNESFLEMSRREILTLTRGEFDVRFPAEQTLLGDWSIDAARSNLERLLGDPEVDLVITWGMLVSHLLCCQGSLPKPVVAPVIIDRELQGLPYENGRSGVENLSYVALPSELSSELRFLRRLVPFRKVALLSLGALVEAIPELPMRSAWMVAELGVELEFIPVGASAEEALAQISPDTEAVYVWPLFHLPSEELGRLVAGINERGLPSFSALGGTDLELGMLASLGSREFFPQLARRAALNVQRILLGEGAGSIPVAFPYRDQLTINMATARALGVSPPWDLILDAEVLHEERLESSSLLTIHEAVGRAVAANLDLEVGRRGLAAGEQQVALSRSLLFPQLEVGARGAMIDQDRARASFGSTAERTLSASANLLQLVYSDAALADAAIQRSLQRSRERDLERLRLDVTLEAAITYLAVLRADSLVDIQRNNLEVTRSNLDLAETRRSLGAGNPAEVFRWQSQIATDRKALIEAIANRRIAEIALNRLLHRDLAERFLAQEVELDDPWLLTGSPRFRGLTETPARFDTFVEFMVRSGLEASPEVAAVEEAVAAAERALTAARRAYWAPELTLGASLEEFLSKRGAGADQDFSLLPFPLPQVDDTTWSIGLGARLPLYAGGARTAERARAEEDLQRLRLERDATAERVEQRIRTAMERTWSSYPGIDLSRQAAEAAGANLDLVADAYARGAVPVIDLLDAQAAALNAEELAANSVYDFLSDLLEVERAANRFDFFLDSQGQSDWFDRVERHFEEAGIGPLEP